MHAHNQDGDSEDDNADVRVKWCWVTGDGGDGADGGDDDDDHHGNDMMTTTLVVMWLC